MKKLLLKGLLWLVSIIRATIIASSLYFLYLVAMIFIFDSRLATVEEYVIPGALAGLLFVLLIVNSNSWVDKEYEGWINNKYRYKS